MTDDTQTPKPLSERPLGYILAVGGGLLGAPLGLVASPAVLFVLNKTVQGKEGKQPKRFLFWALIGIIGAPVCLAISNSAFQEGYKESYENSTSKVAKSNSGSSPQNEVVTEPQEAPETSVSVGDFTISNVRIQRYKGDAGNADVAGELWVAYADVTNNSKETKVPGYSISTEMKDAEGRTFKAADFTVTTNSIVDEAFGGKKVTRFTDGILPGSTRKNVEVGVFDVSEGATGLQLCAGGLLSRTKCISGS